MKKTILVATLAEREVSKIGKHFCIIYIKFWLFYFYILHHFILKVKRLLSIALKNASLLMKPVYNEINKIWIEIDLNWRILWIIETKMIKETYFLSFIIG